ncbi:hypothetical protein [Sphingomonas sp. LT1P40]|uniref:hypothetical protein n=1 Tax=Alteristakelama amylovorans TaxID=3096166 RepID=UPI002FC64694
MDRRTVLGMPLALAATPAWAQAAPPLKSNQTPEANRAIDAALAGWPIVLHGPGKRPDVVVLTLKDCGYCRLFHRDFPQPSRGRTYGYLVGAFVSDPKALVVSLLKNPTLANFHAYMAGTLAPVPAPLSAADNNLYFDVRDKLVELQKLGFRGTPTILIRRPDGWFAKTGYGTEAKERLSRYG